MSPRLPIRLSALFFIGLLVAGSTALGYYYYYVYSPPLEAAEAFLDAIGSADPGAVEAAIVVSTGADADELRAPLPEEVERLMEPAFERGRVLDQRVREGPSRSYHYLVYREPDGQIFALVVTDFEGRYRVVIPTEPMSERALYLWDYIWTN